MELHPQDISIAVNYVYGNWGSLKGVNVTVTHTSTNTEVTCFSHTAHRARAKAFAELQELLKTYSTQLELF